METPGKKKDTAIRLGLQSKYSITTSHYIESYACTSYFVELSSEKYNDTNCAGPITATIVNSLGHELR
jgi:hypothetical protein